MFEAERQNSRTRLFENVFICIELHFLPLPSLLPSLILFPVINPLPSPSIDLTEGSPEFPREALLPSSYSRGRIPADRTYSNYGIRDANTKRSLLVSHFGEIEAAPLATKKKKICHQRCRHLLRRFRWKLHKNHTPALKRTRFNGLIRIFRLKYPLN